MIAFRTVSGRHIDLECLRPDDICIGDIARGLSLTCRFGGQMRSHYSVAQHSLLVMTLVDDALMEHARLHDASEGLLGDVTYHLKHHPGMTFYREIEQSVTLAVQQHFGLRDLTPEEEHQIKHADNLAAIFEHVVLRDMIPWSPQQAIFWAINDGFSKGDPVEMLALAHRLPAEYHAWDAAQAEHEFLMSFGWR